MCYSGGCRRAGMQHHFLSVCLQVVEVVDECDVVCVAKNEALLDGLLTVFHVERSTDELLNLQNDLPLLSEYDKECMISLAQVGSGVRVVFCGWVWVKGCSRFLGEPCCSAQCCSHRCVAGLGS